MDKSGLGYQTLNLVKMLQPDKVLLVDSTPFNGNEQHPEWYENFNTDKVLGFPNKGHYLAWSKGLTHVLTAETFYWDNFVNHAMRNNIRTYIQPNYEFSDYAIKSMTPPTMFLMPSQWKLKEFSDRYENTIYLPPPLFPNDFKQARQVNFDRTGKPRFLHIVGKWASKDRNGTKSLLEALKYTDADFELVIKTQHALDYWTEDKRVTIDETNDPDQQNLYKDFDAMILPRRYAGLCLPMNEALMSGLPVIMTDISPNNQVLPKQWLVPAKVHDKLLTRMVLDVYNADPTKLAERIDWLCNPDIVTNKSDAIHTLSGQKALAFEIGMNYAADNLKPKYLEALT